MFKNFKYKRRINNKLRYFSEYSFQNQRKFYLKKGGLYSDENNNYIFILFKFKCHQDLL